MRYLLVLLILISSIGLSCATTNYQLSSVEVADTVTVHDVTDNKFLAGSDNLISEMTIKFTVGSYATEKVFLSAPDYQVFYNVSNDIPGLFGTFRTENLKTYENGILKDNITITDKIPWYGQSKYNTLTIKNGVVSGANVSSKIDILPASEITLTSTKASKVKLSVYAIDELYRIDAKSELNPLFKFLYSAINIFYEDSDGGVLNLFMIFSFLMGAVLFVIWISISNTYLLIVWIEGVICFYAGWRNNYLSGFVDDIIFTHVAIIRIILNSSKTLLELLRSLLSIIPGIS